MACGMYGGEDLQVGFRKKNLRDRKHTEEDGMEGIIILKWILRKEFGKAWTGLLWLRTRKSGGLL